MGAGIMQLVATGAQDKVLTENPDITFFKMIYRRHTPFSIESKPQMFSTKADFGKTVTCIVGRLGDLINKVILYVHLPEPHPPIHHLIDWVELRIGNKLIDKQSGEYIWLHHQLNKTLPGQYIPLTFWFTRKPGQSLPLVALSQSIVQIVVKFKHAEQFYTPVYSITLDYNYGHINVGDIVTQRDRIGKVTHYDPITKELRYETYGKPFTRHSPINGIMPVSNSTKLTFNRSIINSYLLIDYVYLGQEERSEVIANTHELLIEQVQQNTTHKSSSPNIRHNMVVSNNVKAIYWLAQLDQSSPFNYTTSMFPSNTSLVESTQILFNNQPRTYIVDSIYYNYVQPYQHKTRTFTGLNMYSFAIDPSSTQPSGSANLSCFDSVQLMIKLRTNSSASVRSYAIGYNILRISLGVAHLMFD